MGSDYVMDKDTDAKLFAAALYVISDMWGKEMGDMQRASLANQIVREIERRAILAAPPSPRSDYVMVPRKASDEMVEQARMTLPGPVDICDADIEDIYETMLSAAPSVTGEREPVAWLVTWTDVAGKVDKKIVWHNTDAALVRSEVARINSCDWIVKVQSTPLYDSPSHSHVKDGTEWIVDEFIAVYRNHFGVEGATDRDCLEAFEKTAIRAIELRRASQENGEAR